MKTFAFPTLPESNANDARGGDGRASRRLPELDAAFMKLGQMIVDTEVPGLVHHFALSEEQVAGKNEATSLEDSFASCGCHNDHGALTGMVKAMFMDSTGAVVLSPDPQAGLYFTNRRSEILKASIPPGHLVYQIGETSQILSNGTLQATMGVMRPISFQDRDD
ncbi:hypothetical protein PF006_g16734 [Phytophthora fragariae]|uniref:Uncharacterized protein n=2 Tax=Phytophthora fragariae TaxID=53985 RepID=A0A6A3SYU1_9STRA|nr:hypothetical protein PF006_g16734 [Phytophthora fragariae]